MAKKNIQMIKWGVLVAIVIMIFTLQQSIAPKQAVADVNGRVCATDSDCPCWGSINNTNIEAFGIGVASCENSQCDTSFCFDVEPVGKWIKENPVAWIFDPENAGIVIAIVAGLLFLIFYPNN